MTVSTAELTTQALLPKDDDTTRGRVIEALRRWHDEAHTGTVELCYEQPCHALYRAADEGEDDHSVCLPLIHDCADECEHECRRCGALKVCPDQAKHDADRRARIGDLDLTARPVSPGPHVATVVIDPHQ